MMVSLRRDYSTVRLLVTNMPAMDDLELQEPLEVLLECDKERKGL